MNDWRVNYSGEAKQDLRDIFQYVAYKLLAPLAAARLVNKIMHRVLSLGKMPGRYGFFPREPWLSQEVRFCPVENYLLFYKVYEQSGSVNIVRIIYGKRDVEKQLSMGMVPEQEKYSYTIHE